MKNTFVVAFLTIALVVTACGKKSEKKDQNVSKEAKQTGIAPQNPSVTPIAPNTSVPASEIDGRWWTDCTERSATNEIYARLIKVQHDVLSFGEYTYADMDTCLADDLEGSMGTLKPNSGQYVGQFYTQFKLVKIEDGVMTHRVDYVKQDGSVSFSWVLRLDTQRNKPSFLAAKIDFLTTRNTSDYNDRYFKY